MAKRDKPQSLFSVKKAFYASLDEAGQKALNLIFVLDSLKKYNQIDGDQFKELRRAHDELRAALFEEEYAADA